MYYLFYGEDTFSLKEKIVSLKEQILKKTEFPPEVFVLQGSDLTKPQFDEVAFAVSIFSAKKIVEIRNFLIENKDKNLAEYIGKNLEKIPETTLIIFSEYGLPDKRSSLFKKLNKPKLAFEFKPIIGSRLFGWIIEKGKILDLKIGMREAEKIAEYLGSDLWRINSEIEKLSLYASANGRENITAEDIEENLTPENFNTNFDLIDAVAAKNGKKAYQVMDKLIKGGVNEILIFSMIVYQYRTMLSVLDYSKRGESQGSIARIVKMHPFVVSKTINNLRNSGQQDIEKIFMELSNVDKKIKSGQIEARLALDLVLAEFCLK